MSDALTTNRFTPDQPPSFTDFPRWFAMRCHGTCLEPVIPDGSSCIFDKEASYQAGDYVVIWALQPGGLITPFVKRLVMNVAPWASFPHVMGPNDDISPVVVFETLNPPQHFRADCRTVYGIHKRVGYAARTPDVPIGTKVPVDEGQVHWFDRPVLKKPRRAKVARRAEVAA